MTPDTCPHCGASHRSGHLFWMDWCCGTQAMRVETSEPWTHDQSPECARYVRTRIAHLRRMIQCAWSDWDRHFNTPKQDERIERFVAACLREIDRLRGAR